MFSQIGYEAESKLLISNVTSSSSCFSGCFNIGHASVFQLESPSQDINPEEDFYGTFPEKLQILEPGYKRQSSCDKLLDDLLNLEDSTMTKTYQTLPVVFEDSQSSPRDENKGLNVTLEDKEHSYDHLNISSIEASLKQEEQSMLFSLNAQETVLSDLSSPFLEERSGAEEKFQDLSLLIEQKEGIGVSSPAHFITPSLKESVSSQDSCSFDVPSPSSSNWNKRGSISSDVFEDEGDIKFPKLTENFGTGRYKELRKKNNMASRRSRQSRKEKEREMEAKAKQLTEENALLKVKVKNLEELTNELKQRLIATIVKSK